VDLVKQNYPVAHEPVFETIHQYLKNDYGYELLNAVTCELNFDSVSEGASCGGLDCQASLSSIAAARAPSSAPTKPQQYAPRPATARPSAPAPAVRFSDDTARLQKMHAVRNSAVGLQIKAVIDLLYRVN
jgi:hypothetical protein